MAERFAKTGRDDVSESCQISPWCSYYHSEQTVSDRGYV